MHYPTVAVKRCGGKKREGCEMNRRRIMIKELEGGAKMRPQKSRCKLKIKRQAVRSAKVETLKGPSPPSLSP
jgi:hypothetical protein